LENNLSQYPKSKLFKLADTILSSQQEDQYQLGDSWNYYFPFKNKNRDGKNEDSFVSFLRFSMFRPWDLITMMKILQEELKSEGARNLATVDELDFENSSFRNKYSDYLLGEIKDYLAFYHSDTDYELFLKFFEFLNGQISFSYDFFMACYELFATHIEKNNLQVPVFFESSDKFLQFLFDLNIICYIEDTEDSESHIHWSFRERTYSNINPKVKEGLRYNIHYGLAKAFNTGKAFPRRVIKRQRKVRKGK